MVDTAETLSFTATASSYSGLSSGSNYVAYAVGKTAESPYSSTRVWYGSRSRTVDSQYAQYTFDLSDIPSTATDIQVACTVAGKAENSTYTHQSGGRYCEWGLLSNGTKKGTQIHATSTSVSTYSFSDTGSWTRAELDNLQLRNYVGYYGGNTVGITLTITYSAGGESHTNVYFKTNGAYTEASAIYKKINGSWQEITVNDISQTKAKIIYT